ncbi:hypothetical protein OG339_13570 [Streptosporangium sp. NBC_01495]|uniref:hypothetical protein n=1 Tax=Streptosporangium sp. NBC_01495 TaxID=2903899 RepID=UPI002E36325A|nr:hypothetical protein [Streptosporangium sp. NBC_01495]
MTACRALAADPRRRAVSGGFRPGDRPPVEPGPRAGYGVGLGAVRETPRPPVGRRLIGTARPGERP